MEGNEVLQETIIFPSITGQAFCFLPLPVKTKLPVHVNAYFELSSNRRDIWKADDTVGDSRIRGMWNDCLMKDVIAPLYSLLIQKVKSILVSSHENLLGGRDPSSLLTLLPCPQPTDAWALISATLLQILKTKDVSS